MHASMKKKWKYISFFADFVTCVNAKMPVDFLTVALGDSLTLNCTYNCSGGFVRGCWSKASHNSDCLGTRSKSNLCTVSLHLSNMSAEDLKFNYSCYTQATDDPNLQQKTKRIVLLHLQGGIYIAFNNVSVVTLILYILILYVNLLLVQTSEQTWTVTPNTETKNGEYWEQCLCCKMYEFAWCGYIHILYNTRYIYFQYISYDLHFSASVPDNPTDSSGGKMAVNCRVWMKLM